MSSRAASEVEACALHWGRVLVGLRDVSLRRSWLLSEIRGHAIETVASAFELACFGATSGLESATADALDPEPRSDEATTLLRVLVDLVSQPAQHGIREELRCTARRLQLTHLERVLRRPLDEREATEPEGDVTTLRIPDYGRGRPLTLGERKALARRPSRELLPLLLSDPHPSVIRHALSATRVTEDDVVRLAVRRPNEGRILREVVAHPRWSPRPRVRLAIVQNPFAPVDLAISLVALLTRAELRSVLQVAGLHPALRAAVQESLQLRS